MTKNQRRIKQLENRISLLDSHIEGLRILRLDCATPEIVAKYKEQIVDAETTCRVLEEELESLYALTAYSKPAKG